MLYMLYEQGSHTHALTLSFTLEGVTHIDSLTPASALLECANIIIITIITLDVHFRMASTLFLFDISSCFVHNFFVFHEPYAKCRLARTLISKSQRTSHLTRMSSFSESYHQRLMLV